VHKVQNIQCTVNATVTDVLNIRKKL